MDIALIVVCFFFMSLVLLPISIPFLAPRLFKPGKGEGNFVAEVWLDWGICRGSTMYRQRFTTEKQAHDYARFYARLLDFLLPRYFWSTDWSGRRIRVSNDMSIQYGVRMLTSGEREQFETVWSTSMPGTPSFTGEHQDAHPRLKNLNVSESNIDMKL